jgi:hypothetical protein
MLLYIGSSYVNTNKKGKEMPVMLGTVVSGDIIPARYRILAAWEGEELLACVWRAHIGQPKWTLFRMEGDELISPSTIGAIGFSAILLHFCLTPAQSMYKPEKLQFMSPCQLLREHWNLVRLGVYEVGCEMASHDEEYPITAAFVR